MYPYSLCLPPFNMALPTVSSSHLYAVSMARNLDVQVENKHVENFDVNEKCGFSVKDIQSGFLKLQELCQPGKSLSLPFPPSTHFPLLFRHFFHNFGLFVAVTFVDCEVILLLC